MPDRREFLGAVAGVAAAVVLPAVACDCHVVPPLTSEIVPEPCRMVAGVDFASGQSVAASCLYVVDHEGKVLHVYEPLDTFELREVLDKFCESAHAG